MRQVKPSPGPWKFDASEAQIKDANSEFVADCRSWDAVDDPRNAANGRLLAEAWAMREILQSCVACGGLSQAGLDKANTLLDRIDPPVEAK